MNKISNLAGTTVLILFFAPNLLFSQSNIDSLKKILSTPISDKALAETTLHLCEAYLEINQSDSAEVYFERARFLAEKSGFKGFPAKLQQLEGRLDWAHHNFPQAIEKLKAAVQLFEAAGNILEKAKSWYYLAGVYDFNDQQYLAIAAYEQSILLFKKCRFRNAGMVTYCKRMTSRAYWRMGTNYEDDGNYILALTNYQDALDIAKEIADMELQGSILINFGNNYLSINEPRRAMPYYKEAMNYFNKLGRKQGIGIIQINFGDLYKQLQMWDSSLFFLTQAEETFREIKLNKYIPEVLYAQADIFMEKGQLDYALTKLQEGHSMMTEIHNRHLDANIQNMLGEIFRRKNNFPLAQIYLDTARALMHNLGLKPLLRDNALFSSQLYENWAKTSAGENRSIFFAKALDYFKQYKVYQDSIFNEDKHKALTQQEMTYTFEKKQAQVQSEIRKQRYLVNFFMIGFLIVMLFSLAVLRQRNKVKKEKKRTDALLLNILPAEVADELKTKGTADARLIEEVTVLFSDFKDFTQLSETQTPKALVAEINECFSAFDLIMQKNGVEKIKTVGDAYLAAGGLPVPNATHAINVLNAALEMQQFMKQRREMRESAGEFFFEARIGVHTGPVVAGIVGIKKFAYDIWGDTVNTAQRMESSSEAGKVNISQSTYELVKTQFKCHYRGMISTKGKGEVGMYFVESEAYKHPEGVLQ